MKKLIGVLLVTILMLLGCSNDEGGKQTDSSEGSKTITLKMGNITKETAQLSKTFVAIGEELEKRTNGRIKAQYFPAGQLGNEADMLQQVNTGSLDLAMITTAQLSSSSDAFSSWLMPFLVDTQMQGYELAISEESMSLFDTLVNENVVGLGYASSGFRYLLSTTPITEATDFKGYKIRTTPSPTILDFWNDLGAAPTPMPLTEVYTSLQTGVIKGVDIDSEGVVSENLTEIAKDLTPSKHMLWVAGILINKDLWNSLSEEDQLLLQEIVTEKTKENFESVEKNEQQLLNEGEEKYGVTIHQLTDLDQFSDTIQMLHKKWGGNYPHLENFLQKAEDIRTK